MSIDKESLEISEGALVILSRYPTSISDLKRKLEEDSVWVPKLVVATPTPGKPFIIRGSRIEQKGTPYFISYKNGGGVWYSDIDVRKTLNVFGYAFIPGEFKAGEFKEKIINTLENSFIPDKKDPNQGRLNINIIPGMDTFGYTDDASFRANVSLADLGNTVYNLLFSPPLSYFGYDCYHSGEIGLPSRMKGRMEISIDQGKKAANAIMSDLETKIKLR